MKLEIVVHCWQRAADLAWMLKGCGNSNPLGKHQVKLTVWHAAGDIPTQDTLKGYRQVAARNVQLQEVAVHHSSVCNRAIGRNIVAKNTSADWLWFADCDMIPGVNFLPETCNALAKLDDTAILAIPRRIMSCRAALAKKQIRSSRSFAIESHATSFEETRCCKPLGGILFVRAAAIRESGYMGDVPAALLPTLQAEWETPVVDPIFVERLKTTPRVFVSRWLYRVGN